LTPYTDYIFYLLHINYLLSFDFLLIYILIFVRQFCVTVRASRLAWIYDAYNIMLSI